MPDDSEISGSEAAVRQALPRESRYKKGRYRMKNKKKPQHRQPRLDNDLQLAALDIRYEIDMMIESVADIGAVWGSPPTTLADRQKNMTLECFLLHYRNLRAFLCPSLQAPPKGDDVTASDFLRLPTPDDIGEPKNVGTDKERLDRMLAHLSYSRYAEYKAKGNTDWYVAKMAVAMLRELDGFLARLSETMKPWFPERAVIAKRRVQFEDWATQSTAFAHTISYPVVLRPFR